MICKVCTKCKKEKSLNEFNFRNKLKGIYNSSCKECTRSYDKTKYNENIEAYRLRNKNKRLQKRQWLTDMKSSLKCERCSEDYIYCLDFHHLDSSQKDGSVAIMIKKGYGKQRILDEIKKCIVLCANCHRKEHHKLQE